MRATAHGSKAPDTTRHVFISLVVSLCVSWAPCVSLARPGMCMSIRTPSEQVCPWAAWAVVAKPGARGNCFRVTRSIGRRLPLSRYHGFFWGATGNTLSSGSPSMRQLSFVLNRTKMHAGNWFHTQLFSFRVLSPVSDGHTHPTTTPAHPLNMPRPRSTWSVAVMGIPTHSGNTPYNAPQSWSCLCNQLNLSWPRSGFSRKARLDILSFAMAYCNACPCSVAQAWARNLLTWYFTALVAKMAFALAKTRLPVILPSTLAFEVLSSRQMKHSCAEILCGDAFAVNKAWHRLSPHSSLWPFQLPGTGVCGPCRKAWLLSDSLPSRISFCNPCSHTSRVRSHSTSSVRPCNPFGPVPHTNSWPWIVWATFLFLLLVSHSHGTSPKKVPRGGGNCHISPAKITFKPPKGRAFALGPIKHFFSVLLSFLALYLELSHSSSCWVKHTSPYSQACMYCGICWFNLSLLSSNTPHRKLCCFMFRPPQKIGGSAAPGR